MRKIGRFEVRSELGRGGQSTVYLGVDPQLEREIAIKTVHLAGAASGQSLALLEEARLVGQLRHPNIVPVYEAGEEKGDLYLVFEYVPGRSLSALLRTDGALSPVRSIAILRPILDALEHAHEQGIIHRDLKPSNILLDDNDMPHVMDFGIAARIGEQDGSAGGYTGTPAYMAPEYIERHEVGPRSDVFAAGLVLFEMLSGERAAGGDNLFQIMHRIANVDIRLPDGAVVDERLAGILYKSLARDPDLRYQSAGQFGAALDDYLEPGDEGYSAWEPQQSTLEFLWRRMRYKSDFPALAESIGAINKIAGSDKDSVKQLANAILKDFALTNKLLRLVNSSHFRPAGSGNITTVSNAVLVLGLQAVHDVAISVPLFDHLQNKGNAKQLKEDFLRANLAASLAKELAAATRMREREQVYICALFHNLGRLLAQYYFPEEAEDVRRIVEQKNCGEAAASLQVLGITFEDMGIAIARQWGFPPLIVNSMRAMPPGPLAGASTPEEKLQQLSALANELCALIALAKPAERESGLQRIVERYAEVIKLDPPTVDEAIRKAVDDVCEFARVIQLNLRQTRIGRQMRQFIGGAGRDDGGGTSSAAASDGGDPPVDAQAVLAAAIREVSEALVEGRKLNDILRVILESMHRAMGFRRVVLCTREAKSAAMQGRLCIGPEAAEVAKSFRFPLGAPAADVFSEATSRGEDILIGDTALPDVAARIPDWYRQAAPAPSLLLLPLNIKGLPVALIYADSDAPGGLAIPEKELSLLRALRNQAILAIRQGG